ncbi:MAG: hypothetical protein QOG50_2844, partial [Actinomycetota bacterium]|nr:hypothetical protein [Actinomycetota bacterium]
MAIGITDEHEELRQAVRRFVDTRIPPAVPRAVVDGVAAGRPDFWAAIGEPGWLGLHISEANGGAGYGLVEQAVVVEELGRACAPGPYLPTVLAAAILQDAGGSAASALLPALASGERTGALALDGTRPVLGAAGADVIVCEIDGEWIALDASAAVVTELPSLDLTRGVAQLDLAGVAVPTDRRLPGMTTERARDVAAVLLAAEAIGIAQWCVDTASEYAKVRVQFGRPIGQFQGVKHRCADMLARTELARAAVWDAARAVNDIANGAGLAIAAAAALAFEAAFLNGKDCVQTLGGIGFTWEHDAHLYLRRAITLHQLAGTPDEWRVRAARELQGGARRRLAVDLGPEAETYRTEVRSLLADVAHDSPQEQRERFARDGYLTPGLPRPWGRDAKALELLVIEEEFRAAKVTRANLGVG